MRRSIASHRQADQPSGDHPRNQIHDAVQELRTKRRPQKRPAAEESERPHDTERRSECQALEAAASRPALLHNVEEHCHDDERHHAVAHHRELAYSGRNEPTTLEIARKALWRIIVEAGKEKSDQSPADNGPDDRSTSADDRPVLSHHSSPCFVFFPAISSSPLCCSGTQWSCWQQRCPRCSFRSHPLP